VIRSGEFPSAKKEGKPGRILEVVGADTVDVPFLAIRQIKPWPGFAMAVFHEFGIRRMHLMT
jgi:hypothetical protein